jgi:hypothetical protein
METRKGLNSAPVSQSAANEKDGIAPFRCGRPPHKKEQGKRPLNLTG